MACGRRTARVVRAAYGPAVARVLPDPMRPIKLERSTPVEAVPRKPRTFNEKAPSFADVESRVGGTFTSNERPAVAWLSRRGIVIERVTEDDRSRTPDAVIRTEQATVEIKRMRSASVISMGRQIRRGANQSRHLVIDSRETGLSETDAREWLAAAIHNYGHYIDQVVVILEGPGIAPLEWRHV